MDEYDDQEVAHQARRRAFRLSIVAVGAGVAAMAAGFALAVGRTGDAATGPGVLAGIGAAVLAGGLLLVWFNRPTGERAAVLAGQGERDRLQVQRGVQLSVYPLLGVMFLVLAIRPASEIVAGEGGFGAWLSVLLPVLYAWLTAAIVMGWDGHSMKNRRYLEDELTVVLRARAMTTAFFVLMAGTTAALVVVLAWPAYGVFALLGALASAGIAAGMRFAWLDREAGREA